MNLPVDRIGRRPGRNGMSPPEGATERDDRRGWPSNAASCVWMEAGIIAYKLCDRDFRCESCPFDAVMRGSAPAAPLPGPPAGALPHSFPTDRSYHSAHTWAQARGEGRIRIGLDALAAYLAIQMTGVVLPVIGQRIERGKIGAWLLDEAGPLALGMPATGTVIDVNSNLHRHPRLAVEEPYGAGWLIELEHLEAAPALAGLLTAAEIESRASADLAALRERAVALAGATGTAGPAHERAPGIGATLLDGGVPRQDLHAVLGPAAYRALVQPILAGLPLARLSAACPPQLPICQAGHPAGSHGSPRQR
jgi:glycine cleavage system H protein